MNHKKKNANKPNKKRHLRKPFYTKKTAAFAYLQEQWLVLVTLLPIAYGIGFMGIGMLLTQSEIGYRWESTISIPEARILGLLFLSFAIFLLVITIKSQKEEYLSILTSTRPIDNSNKKKNTFSDYIFILIILTFIIGITWLFTILGLEGIHS